ncbi:MAG: hypothetical protein NZM00_10430 [Anaerolinea sp.]|nr:hypothetical protein [Anaerolinea sp.]
MKRHARFKFRVHPSGGSWHAGWPARYNLRGLAEHRIPEGIFT